jgi:hypothetical protein
MILNKSTLIYFQKRLVFSTLLIAYSCFRLWKNHREHSKRSNSMFIPQLATQWTLWRCFVVTLYWRHRSTTLYKKLWTGLLMIWPSDSWLSLHSLTDKCVGSIYVVSAIGIAQESLVFPVLRARPVSKTCCASKKTFTQT